MAVKKFKVGAVQKKKDNNGTTIRLGNVSKNPKYTTHVQLIVRDGQGNVVADVDSSDTQKFPYGLYLTVTDPRIDAKTGEASQYADKIPDFILKEINVTVADDK